VIGNLIVYFRHSPLVAILGQSYRLFDVGGAVGIAGMMLMLIVAAIRHTITLYRAEPLS
jgi:archaetidylinositol phosphate synthase